ncbi:MAG TPA: hypothetical protein VJ506_08940 [Candidatus Limnocylindrales bacterium]|nr:hypothetical protein [Candidatus Limnocylindrales bacterium]
MTGAAPSGATPTGPTPTGPTDRDGRAGGRRLLGALLIYVVLAFLLTGSAWRDPTNRWIGNCCDQEQAMWYLAWLPTALETGQNPLITDRLNAPDGANLMWNTPTTLIAVVAAPLTRTVGPILTYNVVLFAAVVLSGLACYAALRRYAVRPLGPLVGGALYELSPYLASQASIHLNLTNVWAPPLFLILLDELFVRRRHRPELIGIALGVLGAVQLLTFEEILATSAVTGALLVLLMALVVRDRQLIVDATMRGLRALVPGLATFLLLVGLPLGIQFLGPQQIHGRLLPTDFFSTDLLNLVVPGQRELLAPGALTNLWGGASGHDRGAGAYVGLPLLLVLGCIVLTLRRDRRVVIAGGVAVAMFVFSLGPGLRVAGQALHVPLPWLPIGNLPLLEHALPSRLALYMWLAIAALVAIGIDHALAVGGRGAAVRLAAIGAGLLFIVPTPLSSSTAPVPAFFQHWSDQGIASNETILVAPWFTDGAGANPMLWAAVAEARPRLREGFVFVPGRNGRARYGPPPGALGQLMIDLQDTGIRPVLRESDRTAARRELAQQGISVVIVGPMRHYDEMVAMFTDLLGAPPVVTGGVALWRDVPGLLAAMGSPPS